MSLILRVDVDKPYGHHSLLRKFLSKFVENYVPSFPQFPGYLSHLKEFLEFCNGQGVQGIFFHRLCTVPDHTTTLLLKNGSHDVGIHLENSSSFEACKNEFIKARSVMKDFDLIFFSKHGSGTFKLGKYHYPPYEPIKYSNWTKQLGANYHSGNEKMTDWKQVESDDYNYLSIFWMEPTYREPGCDSIYDLVERAKKRDIVVLIHPENYKTDKTTRSEFKKLVKMASDNNVQWIQRKKQ